MTMITKKQMACLTILKTLSDKYGVENVRKHVMRYIKTDGYKGKMSCKTCKDKDKSMEYCNNCISENDFELWKLLTKQFALTI